MRELAGKLNRLVASFKDAVGIDALSNADSRRIRLAEGMVANAKGRHREALTIVSAVDVTKAEATAEAKIDQAVKVHMVRADAFYGLRNRRRPVHITNEFSDIGLAACQQL